LSQEVSAIRSTGAQVMVFGPIPKPPFDVPGCLSANLTNAPACSVPVAVGLNESGIAAETAAVTGSGGTYVDTQPWFCTTAACAVMVDNLLVYRDDNHITAAYSAFLTPVVGPAMQRALAGQPVETNRFKQ
jgi:alkylation response protein AidB-like acyl-CoA dehydrogenase